jgi:hypothetical protein
MLVGPGQPAKRVWLLATSLCVAASFSFSTLVHASSAPDAPNASIDAWLITDNAGYATSTVVPRADPD